MRTETLRGARHQRVALAATICVVLAILTVVVGGCADATTAAGGTSSARGAPTATTAHQAKPTATMNTGGTLTIGGPAASHNCFCDTVGDGSCDHNVTITVADGAVNKIVLQGLAPQENWDVGFTFGWCSQYMSGATVATVGGQVSTAGAYNFDLSSRRVHLDIEPPSCTITID